MKIVRSPLRITLGGGGTDLPGWYQKYGGFLISAAINKYIYFFGSARPFDKKFWLSYSKIEICDNVSEIKHELLSRCFARYNFLNGFELHSISDIPGSSGMGSSGAYVVGALTLLNAVEKIEAKRTDVAEIACHIEIKELKRSSGKQDQYVAALGGIITLDIDKTGKVKAEPLEMEEISFKHLQNNLLIYFTGVLRNASSILHDQNSKCNKQKKDTVKCMKRIQEIGFLSRDCLLKGDLDTFGRLLDDHWKTKAAITRKMSSSFINKLYTFAIKSGALGGKVMGAGGGGYFLFYVPPEKQLNFRKRMVEKGLVEMDWQFEFNGCSVVYSQ